MSDVAVPGDGNARLRRMLRSNAALLVVVVLLIVMLVIGGIVNNRFRTMGNLANVFEQSTGLALVSLGQTLTVLTGGIDLAIGSLISLIICLTAGYWMAMRPMRFPSWPECSCSGRRSA